jgi:hypothetical protein
VRGTADVSRTLIGCHWPGVGRDPDTCPNEDANAGTDRDAATNSHSDGHDRAAADFDPGS